jgi:O-succinylbenzoate synthase
MYSLSWKRYRRRFRQPLHTAYGLWEFRDGLLLKLEDADGKSGYGEVAPIPWFGTETLDSAQLQIASLGEVVTPEVLREVSGSLPCCRFALSSALAGLDDEGRTDSRRLPVVTLLPAGERAPFILEQRISEGFLIAKIKVGLGETELEMIQIERLCGLLPEGGALRLDANAGLSTAQAARWMAFAADLPIEFVEQPLPIDDPDGLIGLAGDFPTPVALDESVVKVDDLKRWRDRGWNGLYVIKPALAGSLQELLDELGNDDVFVFSTAMESLDDFPP